VEVHQEAVIALIADFVLLLILIVLGFAVYTHIASRPPRTFDEMLPYLRIGDLNEVRHLLDPVDEGFLRLNLSIADFRKAQHHRIHLLSELLTRMSHNARFLHDWARGEQHKSWKTMNCATRAASRELIGYCVTFRFATFVAQIRLRVWAFRISMLRFAPVPIIADIRHLVGTDIPYTYERIKATALTLGNACGGEYQQSLSEVL